jgi:hypothetical protein
MPCSEDDLPSSCVALEIFALSLEHASFNLGGCRVVSAGVIDVFQSAHRNIGVDEMGVMKDESVPLEVSGHPNGSTAEPVNRGIDLIGVSFQDARKCVVRFLNLANNDGLQLSARVLEIEISLGQLAMQLLSGAQAHLHDGGSSPHQSGARLVDQLRGESRTGHLCLPQQKGPCLLAPKILRAEQHICA